ncbi:hypothetical protein [Halopiger thermotolerans]
MTTRTHTRPQTQTRTDAESTPAPATERSTRPSSSATPASDPSANRPSGTDRAPAMFSRRNTDRLENLIDEWNAAFASGGS